MSKRVFIVLVLMNLAFGGGLYIGHCRAQFAMRVSRIADMFESTPFPEPRWGRLRLHLEIANQKTPGLREAVDEELERRERAHEQSCPKYKAVKP